MSFPFPFELRRTSRKVNEVVPSLCFSCSGHARLRVHLQMNLGLFVIQRMQSPLSELVLAFDLPFPFASPLLGALIAGLSSCRTTNFNLQ